MLPVLAGLVLALSIYYAVFSTAADMQEKKRRIEQLNIPAEEAGVTYDSLGNPVRFCPVCKRPLEPGEKVLGIVFHAEPKDKILVKGCRTCNALPAAGIITPS